MPKDTRVKICGLSDQAGLQAAVDAGAAYVGFVFFEKSPRNVSIETAKALALTVPVGVAKVALVVNADDAFLDALTTEVPIDVLQLHGSETPDRVIEIKIQHLILRPEGTIPGKFDGQSIPGVGTGKRKDGRSRQSQVGI